MTAAPEPARAAALGPLYLAGFTTAFGAHGVAAALGVEAGAETGADTASLGLTILSLGLILAIYDIAEVLLKPLFGALSDRIGIKPVIVGGLLVFAAASLLGVFAVSPALLAVARLGQGAAAAAFSPASSAAVARLAGPGSAGRYFGRYGSWKSLGYAAGPLLGAGLILWAGLPALFAALAVLATLAAAWVALAVPGIPVLPKVRATVVELVRQSTAASFLGPVLLLATATAVLGVAVGFLPYAGALLGLDPLLSMAVVTALALISAAIQPWAGRQHDAARHRVGPLLVAANGALIGALLLLAFAPAAVSLYIAAAAIGAGVGVVTPLGFAALAAVTPPERMGRTMGSAELGREIGDAGGPLLVGAVAAATTLGVALATMAGVAAVAALAGGGMVRRRRSADAGPAHPRSDAGAGRPR